MLQNIHESNILKHKMFFRLLETTDRPDGAQANLRPAAYEALMEMVKNSPKDCYVTVQKTTMVIMERLQQVSVYMNLVARIIIFVFIAGAANGVAYKQPQRPLSVQRSAIALVRHIAICPAESHPRRCAPNF